MKEKLLLLIEQIKTRTNLLKSEEATKTSLVLPLLQILGYDIFNPSEVIPEYTCDIGIKKGEKIDYAICQNNEPVLLIECKSCDTATLNSHINQLYRYYTTTKARIAILTNGVEYLFFADTERSNIMDTIPFLSINLSLISDFEIGQLLKFHKNFLNINYIIETIPSIKTHYDTLEQYKNEISSLRQVLEETIHIKNENITLLENNNKILQDQYNTLLEKTSKHESDSSCNLDPTLKDLISYLNMPIPSNWSLLTITERQKYYQDKSKWQGTPRDILCTPEVSCEFYGLKKGELNVRTGRMISDAIRRTGLFIQDGRKKSFSHYGSNIAWIRKQNLN